MDDPPMSKSGMLTIGLLAVWALLCCMAHKKWCSEHRWRGVLERIATPDGSTRDCTIAEDAQGLPCGSGRSME